MTILPAALVTLFLSGIEPSASLEHGAAVHELASAAADGKSAAAKPSKERASDVLARVQAFYESTQDLQAAFRQTYYNPSVAALTRLNGVLKLKKPDKMIFDYDGESADMMSDGKDMWMTDHSARQVTSTSLEGNEDMVVYRKLLFGGKALLRDYLVRFATAEHAKKYGDAKHYVLQLKPRKASDQFKGLMLVAEKATGRIDRFIVYNQDGSTNEFDLSEVKINSGLSDDIFRRVVPSGYVETRE